ncbi:MAG: SpoIVB peptidase S55 domain-containing protein, partial [Candidatus Brocadiia bacterium]|nr:SpoIVB peptidase S55 domain-containing protein [Candidatus Brocadiia bacterium]
MGPSSQAEDRELSSLCTPRSRRVPGWAGGWVLAAILIVTLCGEAAVALGQEAEGGQTEPIMRVADVRPGMKGYGLSTFEGVRIERFNVEVLGTLRSWHAQGTIVLIRMSGRVVDEAGTIAGMSGSPIYIDGKLLGALAYGWGFCKIPLAGVTPIEEMRLAGEIERVAKPEDQGARRATYRRALDREVRSLLDATLKARGPEDQALHAAFSKMVLPLGMRRPGPVWSDGDLSGAVRATLPPGGVAALSRLPLPLSVGGGRPASLASLAPMLSASGFVPIQGGARTAAAGSGGPDDEIKIVPGAPMGAVFVTGDIDIAGMGTLTQVDGNQVLAFGHPMFGEGGRLDYPLGVARVQAVVPSTEHSFKISSTEKIVGSLTRDTETAIVGRLGVEAPMFPCTVKVKGTRDVTYRYKVAGQWEMAPYWSYLVAVLSGTRWEGSGDLLTVRIRSSISLQGRSEPVVMETRYAGAGVVRPIMQLVYMPAAMLTFNEFAQTDITGLEVELEVEEGIQAAFIEGLTIPRREVAPGGTVELLVRLKEFQGPESVRSIQIHVPEDA